MMLGPKDTGAFIFSGNRPLQQWQQEHFNCIWKWPVTIAMTGSGISITCLAAAIVAASMPSGLPHSEQTAAGYQHSVPVTFPDGSSVLP